MTRENPHSVSSVLSRVFSLFSLSSHDQLKRRWWRWSPHSFCSLDIVGPSLFCCLEKEKKSPRNSILIICLHSVSLKHFLYLLHPLLNHRQEEENEKSLLQSLLYQVQRQSKDWGKSSLLLSSCGILFSLYSIIFVPLQLNREEEFLKESFSLFFLLWLIPTLIFF